jgi:RimJ/RimL family protein N-acetyltransferase
MYNYFFNHLNLHKVYGFVFAPNASSLRINLFGGSLDGTLRRHRRQDHGTVDVHVFSILAEEFSTFVRQHARTLMRKHLDRGLILCPN